MQRIELTLKNTKLRRYYLGAMLLAYLNMVILLALSFTASFQQYRWRIYITAGFMLGLIFVSRIDRFNLKENKANTGFMFTILALGWISIDVYWAAALNIIFFALYIYAVRKFEVIVSGEEIILPSFPKRHVKWNELQNMILKDGILTIDFKNNKIMQQETEDGLVINENTFNEFCRQQLQQ